jgi:hypothetical protein
MVQVTCEKTGISFEATSKRTKNHPAIMEVVGEASKNGWYSSALQAIKEGREAGLETIEEFLELLDEARKAAQESRDAKWSAMLAEKRAAKEAKRARHEQNEFLRSHGYSWSRYEDPDTGIVSYDLRDPQGHFVNVQEALDRINGVKAEPEKTETREVVREAVFHQSAKIGQMYRVPGKDKVEKVLICLSCEYIPELEGYSCQFAEPNEVEQQSADYQRIKAALDADQVYEKEQRERIERRRQEQFDAIRATGQEPDFFQQLFAGTSDN